VSVASCRFFVLHSKLRDGVCNLGVFMETRLKAVRESRQWSQQRLLVQLEQAGMARGLPMPSRASLKTEISRWENGHVTPHEPYTSLLAEIYETTRADLGLEGVCGASWLPDEVSVGIAGSTATRVTPQLVTLMDELLVAYGRADNAIGPRPLLHVVRQHAAQLESLLLATAGPMRIEALRLCSRFAEQAGWLCQDAGDLVAAEQWTDRSLDFAEEQGDAENRAYVLMRKSGIAADRRELARAVSLAIAACRSATGLSPRLQALSLRQRAICHALTGEARESEHAAEEALSVVMSDAGDGVRLSYCTEPYVTMESAVSAFHLGRFDVAVGRLSAAARSWPEGFTRDQGLCLARLAVAEVARGNIDAACAVGLDAAAVTKVADSARTRAVVGTLNRRLAPYHRLAMVSEVRAELSKLA
jgi:hypothetical protein